MKTNDQDSDNEPQRTRNSRRGFLATLAKTAAGAAGVVAAAPFVSGGAVSVEAAAPGSSEAPGRMNDCFNYRKNTALAQRLNIGAQKGNGDSSRFTDFSGNYSKALLHDSLGIPNGAAFLS